LPETSTITILKNVYTAADKYLLRKEQILIAALFAEAVLKVRGRLTVYAVNLKSVKLNTVLEAVVSNNVDLR
jgi:hypothetical protein